MVIIKVLVVYYSRTGITKKVAEVISEKLNGRIEEIKDKKNREGIINYMLSGYEAVKGKAPEIREMTENPGDFDLIVIGTPVWAANMASPVRTYINKQKKYIKDYALFCTYKGSGANKAFEKIKNELGKEPIATMDIIDKEINNDSYLNKITEFIKKVKEN